MRHCVQWLAIFVISGLLLAGCDPFRVQQYQVRLTGVLADAEQGDTEKVTIESLIAVVDEVARINEFHRLPNKRRYTAGNGPTYEGHYEVCGLAACSQKRVTIEISSDGFVSIVDWFSFTKSKLADKVETDLLMTATQRFGRNSIHSLAFYRPNHPVEKDAPKEARPSP